MIQACNIRRGMEGAPHRACVCRYIVYIVCTDREWRLGMIQACNIRRGMEGAPHNDEILDFLDDQRPQYGSAVKAAVQLLRQSSAFKRWRAGRRKPAEASDAA